MKDTDPIRPRQINGYPLPPMAPASNLTRAPRATEHDRPGGLRYVELPRQRPGIFTGMGPLAFFAALALVFYTVVYKLIIWLGL